MLNIKNEARTIFLQNTLYTMKMEEGDSMEKIIDSVKNVIMILNNIGEEVKNWWVLSFMCSLQVTKVSNSLSMEENISFYLTNSLLNLCMKKT
jgi:hypothetical protein